MIRKLMASTAVLALISAGAISATAAETKTQTPAAQQDVTAQPAAESAAATDVLIPEQPTFASVYIGRSVFSSEDPESDNIGDVNDLIVGENGEITDAVVGVGGFLGLGEKNVAVPFDKLQVIEKDGDIRLIYSATREELEAAPAIDRTAFDPTARYAEEQAAQVDSSMNNNTGLAPLEPPADTTADTMAPAADQTQDLAATEPAPADATAPATEEQEVAASSETTAAPEATSEPAEATEESVASADAAATSEPAATEEELASADAAATSDAAVATEEPVADAATNEAAEVSEEAAAGATSSNDAINTADATAPDATAPADEQVAASEPTAESAATPSGEFLTFDTDQIRASSLIGMTVFNGEAETVGEVSDLVIGEDGTSRLALIDVGGFLGIGERTVALPFTDLHFKEALDGAASDRTPTTEITVDLTRDQIDQLPEFQEPEQAATLPAADAMAPADDTAALTAPDATTPAPTEEPTPTEEQTAAAPSTDTTAEQPADDMVTGSLSTEYLPATQDLKASELMGLAVYGPDDTSVGEIGDVVFDQNGNIQAIVIDAGGFLGIAEKPVAIGFDKLQIRTDESGARMAMVDMTKEQLDAAPAYTVEGTTDAGTTVQ